MTLRYTLADTAPESEHPIMSPSNHGLEGRPIRRRTVTRTVVAAAVIASGMAIPHAALGATAAVYSTTGTGPWGIAIDDLGNVFTANCAWTGTACSAGGDNVSKIAPGATPTLTNLALPAGSRPQGVAVDSGGDVYTANWQTNRVSKISSAFAIVGSPWPVSMASIGTGIRFLETDAAGNVFASMTLSNKAAAITPSGTVSDYGATGGQPYGIHVDDADTVYTANRAGNSVTVRPSSGTPLTIATGASSDPADVVTDWEGNVYTANYTANTVAKFTPGGTAVSGWPKSIGAGNPGPQPIAMTIDSGGNVFTANSREGVVSKVAHDGTVTQAFATVGTGGRPYGITIDASGNLYVTIYEDSTVWRITPDGVNPDILPAPPAVPATPSATAGSESATVTITINPMSRRYGTPTSYTVTAVEDNTKTCTISHTASPPTCTIGGLTGGTAYTFTSRATLNAWTTGPSDPSTAVTPPAPTPAPAPSPSPSPSPSSDTGSSTGGGASPSTPSDGGSAAALCLGLTGLNGTICKAGVTRDAALRACEPRTGGAKTVCDATANANYRRTVTVARAKDARATALKRCAVMKGPKKAACTKKAKAKYKRTTAIAGATRTRTIALARCTAKRGKAASSCRKTANARYRTVVARAAR